MDNTFEKQKEHNLTLKNRKYLELDGVLDVSGFNDEDITVKTEYGNLLIKGENLHVEALELETGILNVSGKITAVIYNDTIQSKGFLRRLISS